ncbi:MAG TPA: AAA family ATPase [Dehalococcoidia bacterium]|nr:AAA family ATPase [Dehalococcoidia bacterium]
MSSVFSRPIVCPEMVGRAEALESLQALLESSTARGRLALVSGEAGIGKSRLAGELARLAAATGTRVLQARFFEQDEGIPYSAVARLLREVAVLEEALPALRPLAGDLVHIEPSLARISNARAAGVQPLETGAAAEKRRALEALSSFIAALAASRPLLIVFEDAHWGDTSSFDAILQVARQAVPGCLLLLTYRSDEVTPALGAFLAQLDRERLAAEVALGPLTVTQVDRMLRAILGGRTSRGDLLHTVHQLSEGNPFFVEEVLRSLADQAGGLEGIDRLRIAEVDVPRSVEEAVKRRTAGLSERARGVLSLAAVAGLRFDFGLLQHLSGLAESELLGLIKELVAAQIVVEEADDRFAFRHALTREAVRGGLLLRERRALSRRIAQAMEHLYADDLDSRVEDLAWHYFEASEWERALEYSARAGVRALALYAPAAALQHLRRALEAAEHVPGAFKAPLHLHTATAFDILGDFEESRSAYERAAAAAAEEGDARTRWRAVLDLGLLWASRDYARAGECYREAVTLARALDDPSAEATSLNRLGNWYSNTGNFAEARRLSEEALAMFRAAGDEAGEAQTLDLLGMACYQAGEFPDGLGYYLEAVPRLEALGDLRTLTSALASIPIASGTYQTDMSPAALPLREARAYCERAIEVARRTRSRSAESYALWQTAFCLAPQGEYELALAHARESVDLSREIGHSQWEAAALCSLGAIYLDLLHADEARPALEVALGLGREMNSDAWIAQAACLLCQAFIDLKRPDLARDLYASVPPVPLDRVRGMSQRWYHAGAIELDLATGEHERALERALRLEEDSASVFPGRTAVRVARHKGLALLGLGRVEEGLASLRSGLAAAEANGHLSALWRLHADLSRALHAQGQRDPAREHANAALALVERLAASVPEAMREAYIERAGEHLPATLRRRGGREHVDALTAREAEIASLIARGLTNREIADQLVLSARTVETHVANAMAKMGFSNRSQLAAWAVGRGLAAGQ